MQRNRAAASVLAFLFVFSQLPMAAQSPPAPTPVSLDLSSTARSLTSASAGRNPVVIMVGGSPRTVDGATLLTPAERLAVYQVVSSGHQSLVLSTGGAASGGSFNMGPRFQDYVGAMTIPAGVTAFRNANDGLVLNLAGDLINSGTLFAYSTQAAANSITFHASNIINNAGGVISSRIPQAIGANLGNIISSVDLGFVTAGNFFNSGAITSSGHLSINAGGFVVNALPSAVTAPPPTISSAGNLSINSGAGYVLNQGNIETAQNLTLSAIGTNHFIENVYGCLAAAGGIYIETGNPASKLSTDVLGGVLRAGSVSVSGGDGVVTMDVDEIQGLLNITAGEAHIAAKSQEPVSIGEFHISGDPTIFNAYGSVYINGPLDFHGANLAIVASRDVIAKEGSFIDTSGLLKGGDVTIVAGAFAYAQEYADSANRPVEYYDIQLPDPPGGIWTHYVPQHPEYRSTLFGDTFIIFPWITTPDGGKVDLSHLEVLNTSSNAGAGGTVRLIAFPGQATGAGQIVGPSSIVTAGATKGGDILAIAPNGITLGSIAAQAATGVSGNITLLSSTPTTNNQVIQTVNGITQVFQNVGSMVVVDGALQPITLPNGATIPRDFSNLSWNGTRLVANPLTEGKITTGTIDATGAVSIRTAGDIEIGDVHANTVSLSGSGNVTVGDVFLLGKTSTSQISLNSSKLLKTGDLHTVSGASLFLNERDGGPLTIGGQEARIKSIILTGSNVNISMSNLNGVELRQDLASSGLKNVTIDAGNGDVSLGSSRISSNGGRVNIFGNVVDVGAGVSADSATSNGGDVSIVCNELRGSSISANGGNNGNGGNVALIGTSTTQKLRFNSNLNISADGAGGGSGGSVFIDGPVLDFGASHIEAHANSTGTGSGGSVMVDASFAPARSDVNIGTGSGTIALHADGINGGLVDVRSDGGVAVDGSGVTASARGSGYGGAIAINAGLSGSGTIAVSGDIHADGAGSGNGGSVQMSAPIISFGAEYSHVVTANGGAAGGGGTIDIRSTDANANVVAGSAGGAVQVAANGGTNGGNGGTVKLEVGGNLDVTGDSITASAQGGQGNGGNVTLAAGFRAEELLYKGGQYVQQPLVDGTNTFNCSGCAISATGHGAGKGGSIEIFAPNASLGGNSGQESQLQADAGFGGSGLGGNVSIETQALELVDGFVISAHGGAINGSGGTIMLSSSSSPLVFGKGTIAANGFGSGAGGDIKLLFKNAESFDINSNLLANANGSGHSGEITIQNLAEADLHVNVRSVVSAASASGGMASITWKVSNELLYDVIVALDPQSGNLVGPNNVHAKRIEFTTEPGPINPVKLIFEDVRATLGDFVVNNSGAGCSIEISPGSYTSAAGDIVLSTRQLIVGAGAELNADGGITVQSQYGLQINGAGKIVAGGAIGGPNAPSNGILLDAFEELTLQGVTMAHGDSSTLGIGYSSINIRAKEITIIDSVMTAQTTAAALPATGAITITAKEARLSLSSSSLLSVGFNGTAGGTITLEGKTGIDFLNGSGALAAGAINLKSPSMVFSGNSAVTAGREIVATSDTDLEITGFGTITANGAIQNGVLIYSPGNLKIQSVKIQSFNPETILAPHSSINIRGGTVEISAGGVISAPSKVIGTTGYSGAIYITAENGSLSVEDSDILAQGDGLARGGVIRLESLSANLSLATSNVNSSGPYAGGEVNLQGFGTVTTTDSFVDASDTQPLSNVLLAGAGGTIRITSLQADVALGGLFQANGSGNIEVSAQNATLSGAFLAEGYIVGGHVNVTAQRDLKITSSGSISVNNGILIAGSGGLITLTGGLAAKSSVVIDGSLSAYCTNSQLIPIGATVGPEIDITGGPTKSSLTITGLVRASVGAPINALVAITNFEQISLTGKLESLSSFGAMTGSAIGKVSFTNDSGIYLNTSQPGQSQSVGTITSNLATFTSAGGPVLVALNEARYAPPQPAPPDAEIRTKFEIGALTDVNLLVSTGNLLVGKVTSAAGNIKIDLHQNGGQIRIVGNVIAAGGSVEISVGPFASNFTEYNQLGQDTQTYFPLTSAYGSQIFFNLENPTGGLKLDGIGVGFKTSRVGLITINQSGNGSQIYIENGHTIGSCVPLTSLNLSDPSNVQTVIALQQRGLIGGSLEVSGATVSGGITLSPESIGPLDSLDVPNAVSVTFNGFSQPVQFHPSAGDAIVNGNLAFDGSTQIDMSLSGVNSALRVGSAGSLTANGNLTIVAHNIYNDGVIATLPTGSTLGMQGGSPLHVAGSGIYRTGVRGQITISGFGGDNLTISGSPTFDPGSEGHVQIGLDPNSSVVITGQITAAGNSSISFYGNNIETGSITSGGAANLECTQTLTVSGNISAVNVAFIGNNIFVDNGVVIQSTAGSLTVTSTAGNIVFGSNAMLLCTGGNATVQNRNVVNGLIQIGAGTTISATSSSLSAASVYVVIGDVPSDPVVGMAPTNVNPVVQNGGKIFYGANGIAAQCCDNSITASGGQIVFNVGALSSAAIALQGGVTISSSAPPAIPPPVFSTLDFNSNSEMFINDIQQGTLQGTLHLENGVPTGNINLSPANIASSISILSVPQKVVINFVGFHSADAISIGKNSAITGGVNFVGSGATSDGVITLAAGARLTISSTGTLSTDGNLTINANNVQNSGTISSTASGGTINVLGYSGSNLTISGTGKWGVPQGGTLQFTAGNDLNVGTITLPVPNSGATGSIVLNAGHDVNGGNITTSGGTNINGGNIVITAGHNINVGALNASGGTQAGNGGSIILKANTGDVNAHGITSTAYAGNGGYVSIVSGHDINPGNINTSTFYGNGGDVTLAATHNVNGGTINVGTTNGVRGKIKVTAGGTAHYSPISFVQSGSASFEDLHCAHLPNADLWQADGLVGTACDDGSILISDGIAILRARNDLSIRINDCQISLTKGAIVELEAASDSLTIRCLHESRFGSVSMNHGDMKAVVAVGTQFVVATGRNVLQRTLADARIPLRRSVIKENGREVFSLSEFSLLGLAEHSRVMRLLLRSASGIDKTVTRRILNSTASLMLVTTPHGAYSAPLAD